MAKARRKKPVAKSSAIEKNIATAKEKLEAASTDSAKAVTARTRIGKRLTAEVRRLNKRRGVQLRRKQRAAAAAKASPSAGTRKALRTAERELAATRKDLKKAREAKAVNTPELRALRAASRQAKALQTAVEKAEKVLNKPKRKRRTKRATKKK